MKFTKILAALSTFAALTCSLAHAAPVNLVVNGDFETTTNGYRQMVADGKQTAYTTVATGWSTSGYNFVFNGATATTNGATNSGNGKVALWGTTGLASSPAGGNFLGADGAYQVGAITQTINGLVIGQTYDLSFYWAGAQQSGYSGVTTEQWTATLGTQTFSTAVVQDASHASTPWMYETFTYTATATSELLSFLATGTPAGEPPFSLLDGVSLTAHTANVPEPSSWALIVTGLVLLGAALRFGRRNRSV